ncbi:MAG: ABC transporter permease [Thermomicrobiales bacterium]
MARCIARRLILMVVVGFGISLVTFLLNRVVPGNPARLLAGPHARQAQVDALAKQYHLDGSIPEQYWIYVKGLVHGDPGRSVTTRRPVFDDLRQYLPATFELTLTALVGTVVIGIPLRMLSAMKRGSIVDHASRLFSIAGVSMPIFWLGLGRV